MTADFTRGGTVAPPSFQSLYIRMNRGETQLATGTGFLVGSATGVGLVTARHNLTGRNNETGACLHSKGGVPDRIEVHHNGLLPDINLLKTEDLFDEAGEPRWIEHPDLGPLCDVVLLPLRDLSCVTVAPYGRQAIYPDIAVKVAEPVSVVGFPMAHTAGGMMAIWCTGYIASEPSLDYAGQPKFLIDCRTRMGQSGSPVIAFRNGPYNSQDGGTTFAAGPAVRPLGVYTGRIHAESDIGVVWKWSIVEDLMMQFDRQVGQRVQEAMMKFGPNSAGLHAELAKLNLSFSSSG